jgi:hypothetical protein
VSEPLERPTTVQLALRVVSAAVDAYAANPALRAAVVIAVPFVGGAFDALAGTAGSNLAQDRMSIFFEELGQRIAALEAAKRDPDVTVEELVDATIRALRGAIETGDRVKVRMLASILVGATSVERPAELDSESVVASLVSLTPADLHFVRRLSQLVKGSTFAAPSELGPDRLFFVGRLFGAGLLESVALDATPTSGLHRGLVRTEPAIEYRLTPSFWRILELLRAGGETIGADDAGR